MLTPEQWKTISKQASQIYNQLELEIIEEIAKRIANVGHANTVVYNDVLIAQEMGVLYEDITELVAKYNNTSAIQIKNIFEEAAIKSLTFDDKIYKEAGLKPIPIKQSKSMLQILLATAEKTSNNLNNLCMTTASTSQQEFMNAMDKAYLEVSTGVKSYSNAIIDTIKELSQKNTIVEYPSGYRTSIENAVRMNIVTGVNQTCGKLQLMRADEMNWDLMELTAHSGARPEHAEWQGKIVSRSGKKGYLSFDDIGYGEPTGFKGVNCRHDWYPYFKGSSRTYTQEQLNNWKNETVTYNGKAISKYDATQIQRRMERQIRQDKKDIAGLQGILTSNNNDDKMLNEVKQKLQSKQNKLNEHNFILNDFIKQTDSKKDYNRLYLGNILKNTNSTTIKNEIAKNLDKLNIENNPVKKLNKKLTENEIIQKIAGGDETKGSCSSIALTYIGNKIGLDVLDFRGGESQNFFSVPRNILQMCDNLKIKYEMELNYNDILGANNLLNKMIEDKEYYLSTGGHAAIVKKMNNQYQYLELQDKINNGFKQITAKTLKERFGCKQSHTIQGHKAKARNLLIDIDEFADKEEFNQILGYINTSINKQLKGANGDAK